MFGNDVPDLTVPELRENDEDDKYSLSDEDYEEMKEGFEEMRLMAQYTQMAVTLSQMMVDGEITFKEYDEYIEWVEDLADEDDVTLP
jgi:hypothetical protein